LMITEFTSGMILYSSCWKQSSTWNHTYGHRRPKHELYGVIIRLLFVTKQLVIRASLASLYPEKKTTWSLLAKFSLFSLVFFMLQASFSRWQNNLSVLRDRVNWGYHADGSLKLVLPEGCPGTEFGDGVYSGVGNGTNGVFRLRWVD